MNGTRILRKELVYENPYQQIHRVDLERLGAVKQIYVSSYGVRTGIVCIRKTHILLVRQYRLLTDNLAWEIPGGKIDSHETPEEGAARECFEESGLRCKQLHPLVYFLPGLDTCDNPTHVFWCDDFETAVECRAHVDPHEIDGQVWLPFEQCMDMVFERKIVDSMTITALLAWHSVQSRLRSPSLHNH